MDLHVFAFFADILPLDGNARIGIRAFIIWYVIDFRKLLQVRSSASIDARL